ncbi:MAG: HAMP domain-containing sensor histidine kinase [Elainellaceae cyanobacterium]
MHRWYLPTPSEIIASAESHPSGNAQSGQATGQWYGAVAALNELLVELSSGSTTLQADSLLPQDGVILSGPLPVLREPQLASKFSSWTFAGDWTMALRKQLPPTATASCNQNQSPTAISLLTGDPLATESFFLVLTAELSLVAVLGDAPHLGHVSLLGQPMGPHVGQRQDQHMAQRHHAAESSLGFDFSFDPAVVSQCWQALRTRIKLTNPEALTQLEPMVQQFSPRAPEYQLVSNFSRKVLASSAAAAPSSRLPYAVEQVGKPRRRREVKGRISPILNLNHGSDDGADGRCQPHHTATNASGSGSAPMPEMDINHHAAGSDTEILKAIAHEVRTPLSTIRTLTRSLLRRRDLPGPVAKRLTSIDRECTRQIERFGLIFRAVELETETPRTAGPLAKISLEELFQNNLEQWKQQAEERNLTLDVGWTNELPTVLSDPAMLNQMLTGLIDKVTHILPSGSHIQIRVIPAGNQLKLQLYSRMADSETNGDPTQVACASNPLFSLFSPSLSLKSIGQLLMFQPETGNLSLNLDITKNLFQALGGKFTIRHHPQQGEVVTIFLPLEQAEAS